MSTITSTYKKAYRVCKRVSLRGWQLCLALLAALALFTVGALLLLENLPTAKPGNSLEACGRIEQDELTISSLVAGRISRIFVKEGELLKKGQLLAEIDSQPLELPLRDSEKAVLRAAAVLKDAEFQSRALEEELQKSFEPASSQEKTGKTLGKKMLQLIAAPVKLIGKPFSAVSPAKEIKKEIAQSRLDTGKILLTQSKAQVAIAENDLLKAQAARDQLISKIQQYKIYCPVDALCTRVILKEGAAANPASIILVIADPKNIYMRAFLNEADVARLKLGQKAAVYLDAKEQKVLMAHVSQIDSRASFTPENLYFKDERVKQVFGLKLSIDKPEPSAKPGMSCAAEIYVDEVKR
ncbi:MAG: efflux RND transporter periplasmic adaptor subunit [Candidatus Obscuribacterales bacterium]|nr:efflux RND transporter periplasmic adaptor subunit [Candidatus Obscuribacterales bacterium]